MPVAADRDPMELRPLIDAGLYRPSPQQVAEAMLARAELLLLLGASRDGVRPADQSPPRDTDVLRAR
jgi:hypothetical protein